MKKVFQADVPFTHENISYTYKFSRHILNLLRLGVTISNVAKHLGVGWNMVRTIHVYDKSHIVEKITEVVDKIHRSHWK